jgi:uncharacterized protein (UPF0332 family)
MSLAELKKSGRIREIPVDKKQIENLVAVAKRDLGVAESLLKENSDWCYIACYNSMLQISRALMYCYGYTTENEAHHKTVVEFAGEVLGKEGEASAIALDRMRRKRHDVVYDEAGAISAYEAKNALEAAKNYFTMMEGRIMRKISP